MTDDHLDKETSFSAELTETGVKASARSRTIAALDRLVGSIADWGSAHLEGQSTRRRAITEGEKTLIEAAARYGVERMGHDQAFADRAVEKHYRKMFSAQQNREAVAASAIDDLRNSPPTETEASSGKDSLDEVFLSRFERYAEDASTDELRERWGKVLAGEIRQPGTFSAKVLRVVDELDAETARLFERLCEYRVAGIIPKGLAWELSFAEKASLISAGLLIDPGLTGHYRLGVDIDYSGRKCLAFVGDLWGLTIEKGAKLKKGPILREHQLQIVMDIYALTEVGAALSTILPNRERDIFTRMGDQFDLSVGHSGWTMQRQDDGNWALDPL